MRIIQILGPAVVLVMLIWIQFWPVKVLFLQHDSESFPHVTGTITSSYTTISNGARGGTYYHLHVDYRYTVNGTNYGSSRYRYDGQPDNNRAVEAIVASLPKGTPVEVYYNPTNPRDALLSTAVDKTDVALPLLFGGSFFFCLVPILKTYREFDWDTPPIAGGVKVISERTVTRLRLPRVQPVTIGLAVAGGVIILAAVLTHSNGRYTPWQAAQWLLACAVLGGIASYAFQFLQIRSGRQDLVIEETNRTVKLPRTYGRGDQAPMPFTEIRSVILTKVAHGSKSGTYYTYLVTLELKNGQLEKLINMKQDRADALAAWLSGKLGIPKSA
jgi:hypothetical protein